jgi:hypothetical protein
MVILQTPYPKRSFTLPSGYEIPVLTNPDFTDTLINGLYNVFSATYGQRITPVVENYKKGKIYDYSQKTKYLLMSLYVTRNWYNSPFTSVTSYDVIQSIIENCIKISGNINSLDLDTLTADNVYTPYGIPTPPSLPDYSIYTDSLFFN